MKRAGRWSARLAASLVALGGGTAFTSCQGRLHQAIVEGTENFVLGLLDPSVLFPDLLDDNEATDPAAGEASP